MINNSSKIPGIYDALTIYWHQDEIEVGKTVKDSHKIKGTWLTVGDEYSEELTFDDIKDIAIEHGYRGGTITLIADAPLEGIIYKYGNHGNYWESYGQTRGYA